MIPILTSERKRLPGVASVGSHPRPCTLDSLRVYPFPPAGGGRLSTRRVSNFRRAVSRTPSAPRPPLAFNPSHASQRFAAPPAAGASRRLLRGRGLRQLRRSGGARLHIRLLLHRLAAPTHRRLLAQSAGRERNPLIHAVEGLCGGRSHPQCTDGSSMAWLRSDRRWDRTWTRAGMRDGVHFQKTDELSARRTSVCTCWRRGGRKRLTPFIPTRVSRLHQAPRGRRPKIPQTLASQWCTELTWGRAARCRVPPGILSTTLDERHRHTPSARHGFAARAVFPLSLRPQAALGDGARRRRRAAPAGAAGDGPPGRRRPPLRAEEDRHARPPLRPGRRAHRRHHRCRRRARVRHPAGDRSRFATPARCASWSSRVSSFPTPRRSPRGTGSIRRCWRSRPRSRT